MQIYKFSDEQLNNKMKELEEELETFCQSEDYKWYLKYKDYRKFDFDNYSEWIKCLNKRTKISGYLSELRATIDSIEHELYVRQTNKVSFTRKKGGCYEAT